MRMLGSALQGLDGIINAKGTIVGHLNGTDHSSSVQVLETMASATTATGPTTAARGYSPLRSMTTALRALRNLTSGALKFNEALPSELDRLSREAAGILDIQLPAESADSQASPATFQDLGDPTRYRKDQTHRPISVSVLAANSRTIIQQLDRLVEMRAELDREIQRMGLGPSSVPPVTTRDADAALARTAPVEQSSGSPQAAADITALDTGSSTVEIDSVFQVWLDADRDLNAQEPDPNGPALQAGDGDAVRSR
ncbi:hypothetical protein [Noviherbaspirillum aerium]|uniref:hypothetical protein n=1 Tax=Noviherbaspirillum aerium TaxID=2588497 RepID=UPI00178C52A4|nr:hypothetical protein [Noviherbaspirillum aerium]